MRAEKGSEGRWRGTRAKMSNHMTTEDPIRQDCYHNPTYADNSAQIQEWLRKWYPDYVLNEGEAVVPSWFDGSPEAVARLRDGIRNALTRLEKRRAESRSAGADPNHVHVHLNKAAMRERIEELGGL